MANTSSRTLQLLSLLQMQNYWHGPELAERLGVSDRTLRRDVDRLRNLGYAVDSVRGVDGGYQMTVGTRLVPMTFSHEEAVALAIGLRDVATGSDPATAEASLRALAKLVATLPAAVRNQIDLMTHVTEGPGPRYSADQPAADVLGTTALGCRDQVVLRFAYRRPVAGREDTAGLTDTPDEASQREVEPYRLVQRGRRWYLLAFDLHRSDWRTFRVDRISQPFCTRHSFHPRRLPSDDIAGYVEARMRELRPEHVVQFVVHATEREVVSRLHHGAKVVAESANRTRVQMTVDNLDWAMLAVLQLDLPVTIVSPELEAHLAKRSERLAVLVSTTPPSDVRSRRGATVRQA